MRITVAGVGYVGLSLAVITKSFARIHMANLINAGIVPLVFANENDYDLISQGDEIVINDVISQIKSGNTVKVMNKTTGKEFITNISLSDRQRGMLIAGGLLNYTRTNGKDWI